MRVSVITTVRNEAETIGPLLSSLEEQTRIPDEVIIADGGSIDRTLEILERYAASGKLPLRVLRCPGTNISQGRNAAIAAATGDIIAATDAGVWLEPDWLERLLVPFFYGHTTGVAGFFVPDVHTPFEVAMGATVLPTLRDINPEKFLPSSRSVAFRKSAWMAVGGYPEWLDYGEDLLFDFRMRNRFGPFVFSPRAIAHFRPRSSLRAFFRQYYQYARGDGKAGLWPRRHAVRYATYLIAGPFLLGLALKRTPVAWLALLLGLGAYLGTPYRRLGALSTGLSSADRIQAALWVPIIRMGGDIAKMIGYPVGAWWRWKRGKVYQA